jgi:hypothetical protein
MFSVNHTEQTLLIQPGIMRKSGARVLEGQKSEGRRSKKLRQACIESAFASSFLNCTQNRFNLSRDRIMEGRIIRG